MFLNHKIVLLITLAGFTSLAGADWRQFRGTNGDGVAQDENLPVNWLKNVAWKVDLIGRGPSSPIVVGGRVFVTASSGAKQDRLHVLCFDAGSGEKRWERQAWATGRTFCHPTSAVAANTPASDGERVFAFYSSNDLLCFDLDGKLQWFRGLAYDYPKAGNDVGMSSSPVVAGDTVIVQIENQGDSFAAGLDTSTGETRWRIERNRQANWASPTVLQSDDGKLVVLLQSPAGITAHDPTTGERLWEYNVECGGIPSPAAKGEVIYVPSGGITALKHVDGSNAPQILWDANRLSPSSASPIVHRDKVYTVNRTGVLTAGNAEDGSIDWQLRLKGRFWATPVAAGNHLHLVNSDGEFQVVELGEGKLAASGELGESIQGTPAVSDGAIFVRSDTRLWKISAK